MEGTDWSHRWDSRGQLGVREALGLLPGGRPRPCPRRLWQQAAPLPTQRCRGLQVKGASGFWLPVTFPLGAWGFPLSQDI